MFIMNRFRRFKVL